MYPLSTGTLLGGLVLASWVNLFGPTSYTYDQTTGQVGGQSHSDGIFEWSYSPLGQLSTLRQPGNALHRFEYDPDDRLVCQFDPEDRRSDYHYDDVGRLTGIDENQTRVWSHNFHSGLRTIGDTTLTLTCLRIFERPEASGDAALPVRGTPVRKTEFGEEKMARTLRWRIAEVCAGSWAQQAAQVSAG